MHAGMQARLDAELLGNLGRYRRYRGSSLRDLLRVIRNKHNHWRELPEALQQRLGPPPDRFLMCASPALEELDRCCQGEGAFSCAALATVGFDRGRQGRAFLMCAALASTGLDKVGQDREEASVLMCCS